MKGKKTPAAGITVYAELSKAGGDITPNADEDKTAFLVRLTEAVSGLDDAGYDALSAGAQKWFNASGEAINADNPNDIPDLPGLPEISEEAEPSGEEAASVTIKAVKLKLNKESEMEGKKTPAKAVVKSATKVPSTPAVKKTATAKAPSARGRVAANADGDAIKVLAKENPKRAGSESFKRFALYTKNKTVGAFLKAGGSRSDLRYDSEHKFISIG